MKRLNINQIINMKKNYLLFIAILVLLNSCMSSKYLEKSTKELEDYRLIELSAYYSPSNRMLTVNVSGDCTMPLTFSIVDFNGRVLSVKEITTWTTTFDMTGYTSGLYLIRYRDIEGRTGTIKIKVN